MVELFPQHVGCFVSGIPARLLSGARSSHKILVSTVDSFQCCFFVFVCVCVCVCVCVLFQLLHFCIFNSLYFLFLLLFLLKLSVSMLFFSQVHWDSLQSLPCILNHIVIFLSTYVFIFEFCLSNLFGKYFSISSFCKCSLFISMCG